MSTEPVYVLMVLASKVYSGRELSHPLPGQGSTASGSGLEEVVDNPVPQGRRRRGRGLQGLRLDRIQQQRTRSRSLIFQLVAVFKVSLQARDEVVDIRVVAQMQIPWV